MQSSTSNRTDDVMLSFISLINTRNMRGPKTVPCGTSDITDVHLIIHRQQSFFGVYQLTRKRSSERQALVYHKIATYLVVFCVGQYQNP